MQITFLGGTGTVTGSKYYIESPGLESPILVDCGLFQGLKNLRLKNWERPRFNAKRLSAVILTHAHLDHSGYIPLLVKNGFKGPVYCTEATYELCKILLPDSGYLQEEEARYANKRGYSKHRPALPLYTQEDAEQSLSLFRPVKRHEEVSLTRAASFKFYNAGHILGSSTVRFSSDGISLGFSGDLGRPHDPVMKAPEPPPECDYLVVESTYGNRKHERVHPSEILKKVIQDAWKIGGVVIIPAFAVGRAQSLLYLFSDLKKQGEIPDIPIFLNSPMATNVTNLFCRFQDDHRLTMEQCHETCDVATYVRSVEESMDLNKRHGPMVIISASGMATGGRVVHHLKSFIGDPKNTILFAGFQAAGTRGAALVDGAEEIKIHGQYFPVRAKILNVDTFSAHADCGEIIQWLQKSKDRPKKLFVTHGESSASDALRQKVEELLNWNVDIPFLGETRTLAEKRPIA